MEGVHLLASVRGTADQTEQARRAWRQAILWSMNGPAAETAREYLSRYPDEELDAKLHAAQADHTSHAPVGYVAGQCEDIDYPGDADAISRQVG